MRVAALYDIHGNMFALQAVLREARAVGVDLIVVGGDVVPGPMPAETLDCLFSLELPTRFIRGNGDRVVTTYLDGGDISEVPEAFRDVIAWNADQLSEAHRQAMLTWPLTLSLSLPVLGEVLLCHATPRKDTEIFTRNTAESTLRLVFEDVAESTVVCGHTHMQFDRMVASRRIVNAGSVGMPFQQPAGAYWALLGSSVELRRTDYDVARAAAAYRATACPQVEALSIRYVTSPPTEEESLSMFAAAEPTG